MKLKRILAAILTAVMFISATAIPAGAAFVEYEVFKNYDVFDLIGYAKSTTQYIDPTRATEFTGQTFSRLQGSGSHLCFSAYDFTLKKKDNVNVKIEVNKNFLTKGLYNGVGVYLLSEDDELCMTPYDFWFERDSKYNKTSYSFNTGNLSKGRYYMIFVTRSSTVGDYKMTFTARKSVEAKPNFRVEALGNKKVKVSWDKVSGATKYRVCRLSGNSWKTVKTDIKKTSYTISGLVKSNVYKYGVQAYVNGKWTSLAISDAISVRVT